MAKLKFNYATMGSGKSTAALQVHDNYKRNGIYGVLLIPSIDSAGNGKIVSRLGIEADASLIYPDTNIKNMIKLMLKDNTNIEYIVVDEANFLTKEQVEQLSDVVDFMNIDVLCYGILADFATDLFEGSKRLLELSDTKREIEVRNICWCKKKAVVNARIVNGVVVKEGAKIVIKDNADIQYKPLCREHWKLGIWEKP